MATRKGIRALLRADLIRLYNKYHDDLGYYPIYVKQSLEKEYKEYHALKGNDVGTNMYKALMTEQTNYIVNDMNKKLKERGTGEETGR